MRRGSKRRSATPGTVTGTLNPKFSSERKSPFERVPSSAKGIFEIVLSNPFNLIEVNIF